MSDENIQTLVKKAEKQIENELPNTVYDVIPDPSKKGRHFLMVEIKYNPKTLKGSVVGTAPFSDKTAAISMTVDKNNREYLYKKYKKGDKNEN